MGTYPKAHFEVFSAPDVHEHVVFSYLLEVVFVDHEEAAGYHRRLDGSGWISFPLHLLPAAHGKSSYS